MYVYGIELCFPSSLRTECVCCLWLKKLDLGRASMLGRCRRDALGGIFCASGQACQEPFL